MSVLSDRIEAMIKQMLQENNGAIEFSRNEMADSVNCVPSQISYVLSTRFTNGQGYVIESRRGGGGSIRLRQALGTERVQFLMHTVNTLPAELSQTEAQILIKNLKDYEILSADQAVIIAAALSNQALQLPDLQHRNILRASILANILTALSAHIH